MQEWEKHDQQRKQEERLARAPWLVRRRWWWLVLLVVSGIVAGQFLGLAAIIVELPLLILTVWTFIEARLLRNK